MIRSCPVPSFAGRGDEARDIWTVAGAMALARKTKRGAKRRKSAEAGAS
jgi:hypothetical protein